MGLNRDSVLPLILVIIIIIIGVLIGLTSYNVDLSKNRACMELGYDHYATYNSEYVCVDESGNKYFVEMEPVASPRLTIEYEAHEITIGYVRTVGE